MQHRSQAAKLETLRDLPAETADGVRIQLLGNIEFPYEVEQCQERGGDGIGLYRTEFLFLARDDEPTEEEQYAAYSAVAKAMHGPAGRDAHARPGRRQAAEHARPRGRAQSVPRAAQHSPGAASIRRLFRTQLRAILRASVAGNISIMFPLVSTLLELRQAKMVLATRWRIWKRKACRSTATCRSA